MIFRANGQVCDLMPGERILLTLSVNDYGDFASRTGGYSNKFSLPPTKNNLEIFGLPTDLTLDQNFYKEVDAEIEDEGYIIYGSCQVSYVKKNIEVNFFDSNSNWFEFAKTVKPEDVDFSALNHVCTPAEIVSTFDLSKEYVYIAASTDPDFVFTNTYDTEKFVLAWKLKSILIKYFENASIKILGGFTETFEWEHLIIPYYKSLRSYIQSDTLGIYSIIGVDDKTLITASGAASARLTMNNPPSGSTFLADSDRQFIITGASVVANVKLPLKIGITGLSGATYVKYNLYIKTTSGLVVDSTYGIQETEDIGVGQTSLLTNKTIQIPFPYGIKNGDVLEFFVDFKTDSADGASILISQDDEGPIIECINIAQEGQTQDFNNFFDSNIDLSTILKNISGIFNLVFTFDIISRTIYIEMMDKLLENLSSGNIDDWSDIIDLSTVEQNILPNKYSRINILAYSDDKSSDRRAGPGVYPAIGSGEDFFTGEIIIPNAPEGKSTIFKATFAPTRTDVYKNFQIGGVLINWPFLPERSDLVPRILYCLTRDVDSFDVVSVIGDGPESSTIFAHAWFDYRYNINPVATTIVNLFFQKYIDPDPLITDPRPTIIDRFHSSNKSVLQSQRIVLADHYLKIIDIENLDFLKPVFISGLSSYFYKNKIKEFDTRGNIITTVELLKIS